MDHIIWTIQYGAYTIGYRLAHRQNCPAICGTCAKLDRQAQEQREWEEFRARQRNENCQGKHFFDEP